MKRLLLTLLKFGIVAVILTYLVQSGRLNIERLLLFYEHPEMLATMVVVLALLVVPMSALRWWLLLRAIGLAVTPNRAFLLTWIGSFFNMTLPGAVTGDVVKGYYVIREQEAEGRTRAFMTLLIDRFVGLFGLIVMAFIALATNWDLILGKASLHPLAWMIAGLFVGTLLFYGVVLYPFREGQDPFIRFFQRLPASGFTLKVYTAFKSFQHHRRTLLVTLLISIGVHSMVALLFFEIAQMMGIFGMELATQFFIMPIGLITIALPVAPGGIGIGHAAFESLYQLVGLSGGADVFNLYIIVQLAVYMLGGIPYLLHSREYRVPEEKAV